VRLCGATFLTTVWWLESLLELFAAMTLNRVGMALIMSRRVRRASLLRRSV